MKKNFDGSERENRLMQELNEFVAGLEKGETLAPCLNRLMTEKGLTPPQVYHRGDVERQIYNRLIQTRSANRAAKQTLLQVCIGIKATESEAKTLLATCGYTFEPMNNNDMAFLFCLRKGKYDMYSVREAKDVLDSKSGKDK